MPGYKIVLRKNGAKRGELTGYATKSSALAEAQTLADSAGGGVKVYVEPVKAQANRKAPRRKKNTGIKRPSDYPGGKNSYDADFVAGYQAGDKALSRKRKTPLSGADAERYYRRSGHGHGSWWIEGFRAAIAVDRGEYGTKPYKIAVKVGLVHPPGRFNPKRKKNTKKSSRSGKLAWTVVEGPRHLWKAVNTRTGAEVVGSLDQFRYADWRKDHGLPDYIKHIVLHKAYERRTWGARGNPKRKNAIYGSGTDAKFAQWQKKTGLSKAKLEKLAQEAYRMGDDEHMSTLALGKHFKKHLKQKSPSEKTLRQFGDFLFEWGWLELPRLPRTRYNSRRKNYSTGETWLQEADTEMEEEGTVGAFTKQARRAGYKDTMAFARAVMKGWRSGKKTVYNKKTRKQQRITKKTMYRANFAINAQKRRNPYGAPTLADKKLIRKWLSEYRQAGMSRVKVTQIMSDTGLDLQKVFTSLEQGLGFIVQGRGQSEKGTYDAPSGWYVTIPSHYGKKANPLSAQDERIVHHILDHHAVSGVTPGELAKCMGGNTSAYRTKLNRLVKKGWLRKDGRYRYRIVRENPALKAIGGAIGKGLGAAGKAAWTGTKRAAQYGVEYGKEAGARATESAKTAAFATNIADLERCAKRLGITGDELSQLEPYRQAVEAIREHEEKTGAAREARGSRRASALAKRWNPTPGKRGWIPVLFGSNLIILGIGRDRNGNKIIKLSYPNSRGFSIQTLGTPMHSLLRGVTARYEILPEMSTKLEPMLIDHIRKYGSAKQKKGLRVY